MPLAQRTQGFEGGGNPATAGALSQLIACESVGEMRALSPLPFYAQQLIDNAVVSVGLERLTIVKDLIQAGLVFNLPDPLSVMELYWESDSKVGYAKRTMMPDARGENQLPTRLPNRIPIYITFDDFSFNIRTLRASERVGAPLDTNMVQQATRRVNEALEDAAFNGADLQVAGLTAPGILNAPNVNTQVYSGGGTNAWDNSSKTGDQILTDVLNMVDSLQADHFYGPYTLYVPTTYNNALNKDFKTYATTTILQRLSALDTGGGSLLRVRVADHLPKDKTVLIQLTSDVIDMVVGQQPTELSYNSLDGFRFHGMVMAIMVQRVKSNAENASGIVVGYTS